MDESPPHINHKLLTSHPQISTYKHHCCLEHFISSQQAPTGHMTLTFSNNNCPSENILLVFHQTRTEAWVHGVLPSVSHDDDEDNEARDATFLFDFAQEAARQRNSSTTPSRLRTPLHDLTNIVDYHPRRTQPVGGSSPSSYR
jgi:hypothetical protein